MNSPKIEIIKAYEDGGKKIEINEIEMTVQSSGRISWMKDWGQIDELREAGLVEERIYSNLWNHVDNFLLVDLTETARTVAIETNDPVYRDWIIEQEIAEQNARDENPDLPKCGFCGTAGNEANDVRWNEDHNANACTACLNDPMTPIHDERDRENDGYARKRDAKEQDGMDAYLTDGKTWVDRWNEDEKFWDPQDPTEILSQIEAKEIPLIWRSRRVAEFYLPKRNENEMNDQKRVVAVGRTQDDGSIDVEADPDLDPEGIGGVFPDLKDEVEKRNLIDELNASRRYIRAQRVIIETLRDEVQVFAHRAQTNAIVAAALKPGASVETDDPDVPDHKVRTEVTTEVLERQIAVRKGEMTDKELIAYLRDELVRARSALAELLTDLPYGEIPEDMANELPPGRRTKDVLGRVLNDDDLDAQRHFRE